MAWSLGMARPEVAPLSRHDRPVPDFRRGAVFLGMVPTGPVLAKTKLRPCPECPLCVTMEPMKSPSRTHSKPGAGSLILRSGSAVLLISILLAGLLAGLAMSAGDPVQASLARYRMIGSYRTTLVATHGGSSEVIRYSYRKPGFVRMEFIKPHKGSVLVYDPGSGAVRLRPFGFAKGLVLTMNPSNRLVKSALGHRVDQSDIGTLLERVARLQEQGVTTMRQTDFAPGRPAMEVTVEGWPGVALDGTHTFVLVLDESSMLPVRVRTYGEDGVLREEVAMTNLETDVPLDDALFIP